MLMFTEATYLWSLGRKVLEGSSGLKNLRVVLQAADGVMSCGLISSNLVCVEAVATVLNVQPSRVPNPDEQK